MRRLKTFPQFIHLPPELRQRIFLEALPPSQRTIEVAIAGWTGRRRFPLKPVSDCNGASLIGPASHIELCALEGNRFRIWASRPEKCLGKSLDSVQGQLAIVYVSQVNCEARLVVLQNYPDLIELSPPSVNKFWDNGRAFWTIRSWWYRVRGSVGKPKKQIFLRCNLMSDFFFVEGHRVHGRRGLC